MASGGTGDSLPPCGEAGCELHGPDVEQQIRVDRLIRRDAARQQRRALSRLRDRVRRRYVLSPLTAAFIRSWQPLAALAAAALAFLLVLAPTPVFALGTGATGGTMTTQNFEADVVAGGNQLTITVAGGPIWVAAGATFDAERQNIINGLVSGGAEGSGWNAVVQAGLAVTDVVRSSDTVVTITLPAFATYDISASETVTVTVPATALDSGVALDNSPTFSVLAASAAVGGTLPGGANFEADILAGGGTINITLSNDRWVAAGGTFDAQRQNIIDGLVSGGAEGSGWNAVVRAGLAVTDVARLSDFLVRVTLPAFGTYDISANESITPAIPASAITSTGGLTGPSFNVLAATASVGGTLPAGLNFEADIIAGGGTIDITLSSDRWVAAGATFDAERQNIINGLVSAGGEANGWNAVVQAGLAVTDVARISDFLARVTLPAFGTYDISAAETVTLTIPAGAVTSLSGFAASPTFDIVTPFAATSGSIQGGANSEGDIVSGGGTVILTVGGDTWVAAGGTFDTERQNIIDGLVSGGAEGTGWNAVVQAGLAVTAVVRSSDTVVTITLPAFAGYDISAAETITATVPATALTSGVGQAAPPTFNVLAASAAVGGSIQGGANGEAVIVTGGGTIVLTLTNDAWAAAGGAFDAERQNIINGLVSGGAEGSGWNAVVQAGLAVTDVVRTSDTVVTITLPAFGAYNITADESISVTIPATARTSAGSLGATPAFPVTAAAPPPPPPPPPPAPPADEETEETEEAPALIADGSYPATETVEPTAATALPGESLQLSSSSPDGSLLTVTVEGIEAVGGFMVQAAAAVDPSSLESVAPAPLGALIVAAFVVDGTSPPSAASPLIVDIQLAESAMSPLAHPDELFAAVWESGGWRVLDADIGEGAGFAARLTSRHEAFGLFAVLWSPISIGGDVDAGGDLRHVSLGSLARPQAVIRTFGDVGCSVRVIATPNDQSSSGWDIYVHEAPTFVNNGYPVVLLGSVDLWVRCDPRGATGGTAQSRTLSSSGRRRERRAPASRS